MEINRTKDLMIMMNIPVNQLKIALRSEKTQLGLWLASANAYTAEMAATSGFNWLLIDGEHGPNDIPTLLAQLQAVAPYPCQPIVRPVNQDPALIKQLLDIGAQTLLVPMVETAQQARDLVRAMRYAPRGIRGVGASIARAARWGTVNNYEDEVEQQLCLLVQVESVRGIDNLAEILQVEGVDGVFIGPADLSATMGHMGNPLHPEVDTTIKKALAEIRAAGKAAGCLSIDPAIVKRYVEYGANFVAAAIDTVLLIRGMSTALAEMTGAVAEEQKRHSY
jgi:4-hydroxy-2-oxoheptanedioate aldolase